MKIKTIDINADLGEGSGNDAAIMPFISSCNIACGGHFGDEKSMRETIVLAKKHQVKVGAHPSFPDKANFGRQVLDISDKALEDAVFKQINAFVNCCNTEGLKINHIKPHGALYNIATKDQKIAAVVLKALERTGFKVPVYVPFHSVIARLAKAKGMPFIYEAFADRLYHNTLQLVSRAKQGAVISDPETAWQQVYDMLFHSKINTVEGDRVTIKAETLCVHGDQPQAMAVVKYIYEQLHKHEIKLA